MNSASTIFTGELGKTVFWLFLLIFTAAAVGCEDSPAEEVYTVTFDTNSGGVVAVVPQTVRVRPGEQVSAPSPSPSFTRKRFDGWYRDAALRSRFVFTTPIEADITLYAKWTDVPNGSYLVRFDSRGGSETLGAIVEAGKTVRAPNNPRRDRYRFDGWYNDAELQNKFVFTTPIEADITLYAKWTEVPAGSYLVRFDSKGGTDVPGAIVQAGQTASSPDPDPIREGYTFEGWFTDDSTFQNLFDFDNTPIAGEIILYAKWENITHTVTFDFKKGDGAIEDKTVWYKEKIEEPEPPPTREGYTFDGWFTDDDTFQNAFNFDTLITADITLYARWEAITYTVTFDPKGGSLNIDVQNVQEGKTATEPQAPTREGYVFEGWYFDGEQDLSTRFDFTTTITNDLNLYAQWTANRKKVIFDVNYEGSDLDTVYVRRGDAADLPKPTRKGFTFGGWYIDAALQRAFSTNTPINEDLTLYARWNIITYTVTFERNEGSPAIASQTVAFGKLSTKPNPEPTLEGSVFAGWYSDKDLQTAFDFEGAIVSDTTLYAKWKPQYTVSFEANGGSPVESVKVAEGDTLSTQQMPAPTRDGYVFAGWYSEAGLQNEFDLNTPLTDNIRLYAKWTKELYKVIFHLNNGYANAVMDGVASGSTIQAPADPARPRDPARMDTVFIGWFTDPDFQNEFDFESTPIIGETNLYAKWEPQTGPAESYTVRFETGEGSSVMDVTVEKGEKVMAPDLAPTRDGYTFVGWYSDADRQNAFNFDSPVDEDITLYAKWESIFYTISFDATGGGFPSRTGDSSDPTLNVLVTRGSTVSAPQPPERNGYNFLGWYSDSTLQTRYNFGVIVMSDFILYAKWNIITYTVTFNLNGGPGSIASLTVEQGKTANSPNSPTREGYTFVGWFTDPGLQNAFGFDTPVTNDLTLYAKWEPGIVPVEFYMVNFDLQGASPNIPSQRIEEGKTATEPNDPVRTGYTFAGWYTDDTFNTLYSFSAPVTDEVTLYAKWEAKIHVVRLTYTSETGSSTIAVSVPHGQILTDRLPKLEGYIFEGWYTDNETFQNEFDLSKTPITESINLYGKWTIRYTIASLAEKLEANNNARDAKTLRNLYNNDAFVELRYLKPNGTGDGSSWTNAAGNLKTVLDDVVDAAQDRVYAVFMSAGTFAAGSAMSMKDHVAILGGYAGQIDGDFSPHSSSEITRLSGEGSYRVFDNRSVSETALLYDMNVQNGFSSTRGGGMYNTNSSPTLVDVGFFTNSAESGSGGGMYNDNSSPRLTGVTFSSNTATDGGGIYNENSSPILEDVVFFQNSAESGSGGGMYNDNSSPTFTGIMPGGGIVRFSSNTAQSGGGMYNTNSSPDLTGVLFSRNTATDSGGGMYNDNTSSPTLTGVFFTSNTARDGGGGMYNDNASSPTLIDVSFTSNTAATQGGGMHNDSSSPTLTGVSFTSNTASNGGGMHNDNLSSPLVQRVTFLNNVVTFGGGGMGNNASSPILANVTFSGNEAQIGGGMYNEKSSPSIVNVTFANNEASNNGGGMYNDNDNASGPVVVNSIFWGNTVNRQANQIYILNNNADAENLALYYSVLQGGIGGIKRLNSANEDAINIVSRNIKDNGLPMLGALGDYGGFVQTIPIGSDGLAKDLGLYLNLYENTLYYSVNNKDWFTDLTSTALAPLPADAIDLTATDARGYVRQNRPDAGAYEVGATPP